PVPAVEGAARQLRQPALGRRAADARHRPRPDDQSAPADPGRSHRGPRAAHPPRDLPLDRAIESRRAVHPCHRQGRQSVNQGGGSPLRAGEGARSVERQLRGARRQHRAAAPLSGRMKIDRSSTAAVVATNVAVIGIALWQHWPLVVLLWPYWLQSVIIGWYSGRRILALRQFSLEGTSGFDQGSDEATKHNTARFFAMHYGVF